jgi:hypothetical protein
LRRSATSPRKKVSTPIVSSADPITSDWIFPVPLSKR